MNPISLNVTVEFGHEEFPALNATWRVRTHNARYVVYLPKFVRAAMNKVKCPLCSLCWTSKGKRLITGASTGEITL